MERRKRVVGYLSTPSRPNVLPQRARSQRILGQTPSANATPPLYSLDVAPENFFLFPRIKTAWNEIRFLSIREIQLGVTMILQKVPPFRRRIDQNIVAGKICRGPRTVH